MNGWVWMAASVGLAMAGTAPMVSGADALAGGLSEGIERVVSGGLVDARDRKIDETRLIGKYVGFYFAASVCGECRKFTPDLIRADEAWRAEGKPLEIVVASLDTDSQGMKTLLANLPWPALAYDPTGLIQLSRKLGVTGTPTLVVFNPEGQVVSVQGRSEVVRLGAKAADGWISPEAAVVKVEPTPIGRTGPGLPRWARPTP